MPDDAPDEQFVTCEVTARLVEIFRQSVGDNFENSEM